MSLKILALDEYKYSGYGIGYGTWKFSLSHGSGFRKICYNIWW